MTRSSSLNAVPLLALAGLGLSAIAAVPAQAQCDQWDISGKAVQIDQSAGGYAVFDLALNGENVSGTAQTSRRHGNATYVLGLLVRGEDYSAANGSVDGAYSDGRLELQVRWSDGKIGIYDIQIDPRGRLTGTTYDFTNPASRASIIGVQRLSCAQAAAPEPARRPVVRAPQDPASSGVLRSGTARRLGKGPAPAPAAAPVARRLGKGRPAVDRSGIAAAGSSAAAGSAACKSGYVARRAGPMDGVCVTPASRSRAATENASAPSRWVAGDYGPQTCRPGFVWREAFSGDNVCVVPGIRAFVNMENRLAASRRMQ